MPAFLAASFAADQSAATTQETASCLAFLTIAIGGLGSTAAGVLADRIGRTLITIVSMIVSGACCIMIGFLFGGPAWLVVVVCLIWGFAVVADSAQFSTCISELGEPEYVGTALTLQTADGFLITVVTIRLLPVWESAWGWEWAFAPLVIGPAVGTWSMFALRRRPESQRIAGGRR